MTRFLLLFVLLISACTTTLPTPPPLTAPLVWQAQVTPALAWMVPILSSCMREHSGASLVVLDRPAPLQDTSTADFTLRWGAPASLALPATVVGEDELVFIVHPSNPVSQLTMAELRSLLVGKVTTWNQVLAAAPKEQLVVYAYGDGEDIQSILDTTIPGLGINRETGWLAPDPGAVRQAVAASPKALGYIPKRWLDTSVKVLKITDLTSTSLRQPVLVITPSQPQGVQKEFLKCLTESAR